MPVTTFLLVITFMVMRPGGAIENVERQFPTASIEECKATALSVQAEIAPLGTVVGAGWVCVPQRGSES